jgi:hypothetical protein
MKSLFLIGAAMLLGTGAAFAQAGTAGVTSTVSVDLRVETKRDMVVGTIERGQTKIVPHGYNDPSGMKTAQFKIKGDQNDFFKVVSASGGMHFIGDPTLVAPGDVTTMTGFDPTFSSWGVDAAIGENNALGRTGGIGTGFVLDGADGPTLGQAHVWVGMSWTAAAAQQRGNYQGTVDISVAYL